MSVACICCPQNLRLHGIAILNVLKNLEKIQKKIDKYTKLCHLQIQGAVPNTNNMTISN